MSKVIYLEDPREQALRLIYGGRGFKQIERQAKNMHYDYFKMLSYGEALFDAGILCIDHQGRMNVYANDNKKGKTQRSR